MKLSTIKKIFSYSKDCRKGYILALFINSFSMIRFSFVIGFPIKWITDSFVSKDYNELENKLILTLVILVINSILTFFEGFLMESRATKIAGNIKKDLIRNFLMLKPAYFDKKHTGDLLSRLTSDMDNTEKVTSFDMVEPINALSLGLSSIIFTYILNWKLGVIALSLAIFIIIINSLFLKPIEKMGKKIHESIGNAAVKFSDIINGMSVIKTFRLENWVKKRYENENKSIFQWNSKLLKVEISQISINDFLNYVASFGILFIGIYLLIRGEITAGSLLALKRFSSVLTSAFIFLGKAIAHLAYMLTSAERVFDVIDEEKEDLISNENISLGESETVLSIKDLTFQYNSDTNVIEKLSLDIKRNETVAIVGASGSGKSTLMKLILGFYHSTLGSIYVNDQNINSLPLNQLRDLITYVPQKNYLFSTDIKSNIAMGNSVATDEDIIAAGKSAYIHDYIIGLKDGYSSSVGEGGAFLSGGQRQRVAIARALLKDAPIVLLDEATASLDSTSEEAIHKALEHLMENRTVLIAAHRLSTIKHADKIIVMDRGRIVESGKHSDLLENNGKYREFYNTQFG